MADTIGRMPRPRGLLSERTIMRLAFARERAEEAQASYRSEVVIALQEGSFSAVADATGLSKQTLQRWKKESDK